MANLTIEVPDDLVRGLEAIAAAQRKTVQQLALERLSSLVEVSPEPRAGSPAALLRAMQELPHPSAADGLNWFQQPVRFEFRKGPPARPAPQVEGWQHQEPSGPATCLLQRHRVTTQKRRQLPSAAPRSPLG